MKISKFLNYTLILGLLFFVAGCEEAYNPYPAFETVPHAFGAYDAGTPTSFLFGKNGSKLSGNLQWKSTDNKVTVDAIDLYITWSESYKDKDGLPKTAVHGKKKLGPLASVGAAREAKPFSFTATDVYNLFKDVKFDYDDGKGLHNVFVTPKDVDRKASSYFTSNDKFVLSWGLKATDGRYFDTWSQGICSESVGSNCSLSFGVICVSNIGGTYDAVAVGKSTDSCCPNETTVTSVVTLTAKGSGKYELSDFSGGLYMKWYSIYGIDAAYVAETDKTKNKLRGDILDACDNISGAWVEPFSESMKITGLSMPDDGKIVYSWVNGYDDKGTVTLTKK